VIKFHYHPSPNSAKVALFLEESGVPYEVIPVDTRKDEMFEAGVVAFNPSGRTPTIMDGDIRVFDSTAILLYLAEKTGQFMPGKTLKTRGELLSWLMFIGASIGPYSGQAAHFKYFAPLGMEYAVERYHFEVRRRFGILDAQLADGPYLLGEAYTVADMAAWGWARVVPFILGDGTWESLPHLKRWFDMVNGRPAAVRASMLKYKHSPNGVPTPRHAGTCFGM
jgi:GSH-dependent disulfide-bond oxidoreductase